MNDMNSEFLTDLNGNPTTTFKLTLDVKSKDVDTIIEAGNNLRVQIQTALRQFGELSIITKEQILSEGDVWLHSIGSTGASHVVFDHNTDTDDVPAYARLAIIPALSEDAINKQIDAFGYQLSEDQRLQMFITLREMHKEIFEKEFHKISLYLQDKFELYMTID
jgi:hypothetical protein